MVRYNLIQIPVLRTLLTNRWPQLIIRAFALGGFLLAILAGFVGTPVGNRNFAIIMVWIAWWALLIMVAVPLFGRGWCSICPIPIPGEWLQNGTILGPLKKKSGFGLKMRWPNKFRNIWLQNVAFTVLALFSIVILTQPRITGIVLLALILIAVGTSYIFERRTFCRYLCPVGGFIGLYSQVSPIEVRVRDTSVCAGHKVKTCYTGNEDGYGCPWGIFPGGMVKNTNCGTCMECLRTCPYDNIAVNLRPPGTDLLQPRGRKLDEAFKAFIMLGSAVVYSVVLIGPWGALKTAAFAVGSFAWWGYALGFLAFVYLLLPGIFYLAVRYISQNAPGKRKPLRMFTEYAYALVPLGLAAWIAFSLSFVFTNVSYLWSVLSDPFSWGWNLFGAANSSWTPYFSKYIPPVQVVILIVGLFWSITVIQHISGERTLSENKPWRTWPVVAYSAFVTVGLLWLLVG